MKQSKTTTLLMLASLLMLAVFLAFWLRSTYRDAADVMTERGNFLYQEAVREIQDSVYQKFILRFVEKSGDSTHRFPSDFFEIRENAIIDTSVSNMHSRLQIKLDTAEPKKGLRFHISNDSASTTRFRGLENEFPQAPITDRDTIIYIENLDRLTRFGVESDEKENDLRIQIQQRFQRSLVAADLPAEYDLVEIPPEDPEDLDFFPGRFNTYLNEEVVFTNSGWYLGKQVAGPFAFSVLLFLLTLLAFWSLRRSNMRALQYSRLKSDFMSNMTHELKTPITTVGLAVEAMQGFVKNNQQEKLTEYLTISQHELSRLDLLVDKVLKLSLFENDIAKLKKEPVNLKAIFLKVKDAMSIQLEQRGGTLDWRIQGNDFNLSGDAVHLGNVLFNLLDNALKYAGDDPPQIEVDLVEGTETLTLSISDQGIGIPASYQRKVFDRFFRVPQTGNRHNVKGYGLGLSYVADIVRRHGGDVSLRSEPGQGTIFTLKLARK